VLLLETTATLPQSDTWLIRVAISGNQVTICHILNHISMIFGLWYDDMLLNLTVLGCTKSTYQGLAHWDQDRSFCELMAQKCHLMCTVWWWHVTMLMSQGFTELRHKVNRNWWRILFLQSWQKIDGICWSTGQVFAAVVAACCSAVRHL